ncbi:MerR family transcriptional regulator [Paracoccus sp. (in: a-proteobacteria)]|uniref:MerR family transcriptional regulator n=1 Tax=Paracoccus sp. TaxID=267 RepID=UPI00396CF129
MPSIGKLSVTTGVKVSTIRYYEDIGLLSEAKRSAGNQRLYRKEHQERLAFIHHARKLGLPLKDIRELLSLSDQPDMSCAAADVIASRPLASLRNRITRLQALQQEPERMLTDRACGTISDCKVIEVLSDHKNRLHVHHGKG